MQYLIKKKILKLGEKRHTPPPAPDFLDYVFVIKHSVCTMWAQYEIQ